MNPRKSVENQSPFRLRATSLLHANVLAVLLCVAALAATAYVSTAVFDRLPHTEDEIVFLFQARTLATGQVVAGAPAQPDFFVMPFTIVRDGLWFGKYPPGFPAVLALGVLAGRPWLLNPLFAALSVGLLYIAGRRVYNAPTGILAAALAVVSPFFLIQGGSFLSHTVSLFWSMAFLLLFAAARRNSSRAASAGAGAVLGMLFLSRPLTAVGIAVPFVIWAGIDTVRSPRHAYGYLPLVLAFLPFLGAMLAYNNLTTGDVLRTGYELWWHYDRIGFGSGFGVGGQHTLEIAIDTLKTNVEVLDRYLFGWPVRLGLVPAALAGVVAIARTVWRWTAEGRGGASVRSTGKAGHSEATPDAWDILQLGVVTGLMAVYMAYWAAGQMYGPRYYFEALGALLLLTARGLLLITVPGAWLLGLLMGHSPRRSRHTARGGPLRERSIYRWVMVALLLTVAGLAFNSFTGFVPREFGQFVGWYNIDRSDLRVVEEAGLSKAVVFITMEDWTEYAPFFSQNTPTLDGDVIYAVDLGPSRNRDLMALYPGRMFFRYAEGRLEAVTPP